MTDEQRVAETLPPQECLDKASRTVGLFSWTTANEALPRLRNLTRRSIIAHARALQEIDRLRDTLKVAREALVNHACHYGVDRPCLRSKSECDIECGYLAGCALIQIDAALKGDTHDR